MQRGRVRAGLRQGRDQQITFSETLTVRLNGDEITVYRIPPAHTDGDAMVRWKKANVVHTGDVFSAYRYPFIDVENGGSVLGTVRAMDKLLPTLDDSRKVMPGHGPLSTKKDVVAFRDMLAKTSSRVQAAVSSRRSRRGRGAARRAAGQASAPSSARRSSGTGMGRTALTSARPVLPIGTQMRENRAAAMTRVN